MALHFSHIARYAPSIQSHIHLKSFAQILTLVMKHPLTFLTVTIWGLTFVSTKVLITHGLTPTWIFADECLRSGSADSVG